jgi:hypothetical protein
VIHFSGNVTIEGAVAVRSTEILQPVEGRFRHVAGDALQATIQLVADQDATARAWIWSPPADAVRRLLSEIGEDFVFEGGSVRQANADRRSRVGVGRLDIFGIWLVEASEIVGSHKGSVAPMMSCGGGRNRVMLCE